MSFAYPLPFWLLGIVLAATVLLAFGAYARLSRALTSRQRAALVALRWLSLVLLVVFLMRPVRVEPLVDLSEAVVPVILDTSRSMGLADVGGRRRADVARELVRDRLVPVLDRRFAVDVLSAGDRLAPADLTASSADGRNSDLEAAIEAVRERYRDRRLAGIVLVSDGAETSSSANLAAPPAPIFVIGVGSPQFPRDREVVRVTAGAASLADSVIELTANVVSHGFGTDPIELRLFEDGRLLQVRQAKPSGEGTPVREVFRVSPKRDGPTRYTVEIPAEPAEVTDANNQQSVLVDAPGRRRRILLVEGAPGFEHSFLKRALDLDPSLDVDAVVRKGRNEEGADTFLVQAAADRTEALTRGLPPTRRALFAYDAIVLANIEGDFFTRDQLRMLADFVSERGGGLLVTGAASFDRQELRDTPLEEVLPLELTPRTAASASSDRAPVLRNRAALSAEGELHPLTRLGSTPEESRKRWSELPPLASSVALGAPRPAAEVLVWTSGAGGAATPLIAVQPYGRGRSVVFAGEGAWRWKMSLPSSDSTYETFWRQVVRWLSSTSPDPVSLTVAPVTEGEPLRARIDVRDEEYRPVGDAVLSVAVTDPGGTTRPLDAAIVEPSQGRFEAGLVPDQGGPYRIEVSARRQAEELGASSVTVLVGGESRELADPRRNDEVLSRLARISGGRVVDPSETGRLPDWLASGVAGTSITVQRDLWHNAWSFTLVLAALSAEWILRRRWGLR